MADLNPANHNLNQPTYYSFYLGTGVGNDPDHPIVLSDSDSDSEFDDDPCGLRDHEDDREDDPDYEETRGRKRRRRV